MVDRFKYKKKIKYFAGAIIRYGGLFFLFKKLVLKNRATIVIYHNPKYEYFEKHINFYLKHFNIISLKNYIENILHNKNIPAYTLILTIDDGYKENYSLLPIIKKHCISPTIYVCGAIVGTNCKFWFDIAENKFVILEKMERKKRNAFLKKHFNYSENTSYSPRTALSVDELIELDKYADIQSHTMFHPILTNESPENIIEEIVKSKNVLEKILSKKICHFSYPNGNYSKSIISTVAKAGYISARSCDIGWNKIRKAHDLYKLKALGIQDDASINVLCAQITGIFGFIRLFGKN